jgi:hypothetical protein
MTIKLETVEISPTFYQVFVVVVVVVVIVTFLHVQMILNKLTMVVNNDGTSNWNCYLN